MLKTREFWAAVREQAAALPEDWYYVISVDDPSRCVVGGAVSQVSRQAAAELIVARTHRLATAEEIEQHLRHEQEERERYMEAEQRRIAQFHPYTPRPIPAKPKTKE